ncbi:MAG: alpha/beta hydrolase, partial [Acetatifactor sp.]|nr:alpha/beta hydrolase [Acetatifactor sp.]
CGFTSPYEMLYEVGRKTLHVREHPDMDYVNLIVRLHAHFGIREYSTLEAVKKTSLPIFFVHGLADDFVPCHMTLRAYEACASRKELLLVEGAGHVRSFFYDNENYRRKVEIFFGWQI